MLCPEVWNFSSPAFTSFCREYETEENLEEFVKRHYFNHYISITLPNTLCAPEELKNLLEEDMDFYKVEKVPTVQFFETDFINLFVRKGQLTALSVKELSGRKDALACTPDGKIILSLTKETYQELGLTFKNISQKKHATSYCFAFDVMSGCENVETNLKHIRNKLSECKSLLNFDIILAWEPDDDKICPSSIAYYFNKKNYFVKTCPVHSESRCEYNVVAPIFNNKTDVGDFVEWLGAFGLQCQMDLNNYLSSFKSPEESENLGQVVYLSSTGLLTTNRINKIISKIRDYINTDSRYCWIAVIVQAFRNTILHKKNNQFFFSDGDQHYCLLFKRSIPSLVYYYAGTVN